MPARRVGQENIRQSLPLSGLNQLRDDEFGGNRGDFVDKDGAGNAVDQAVSFIRQNKLRNPARSLFYVERTNNPGY